MMAVPPVAIQRPNSDCYFYYYSSCTKGASCPFRHEPSALRNETMCRYWLQGLCKKPNCIFRHMEVNKPRDKIACFFEKQPGGCKKIHCSFFHSDIQNQPREEDIEKKPDLILPVKPKDGEFLAIDNDFVPIKSIVELISMKKKDCDSRSSSDYGDLSPRGMPAPMNLSNRTMIIPVHDGESDTESITMSPQKANLERLSPEHEWELQKLRRIQIEEGMILGYSFEEEDNVSYSANSSSCESEEIVEYQEDVKDAIHRRIISIPSNDSSETLQKVQLCPMNLDLRKMLKRSPINSTCGSLRNNSSIDALPLHKRSAKDRIVFREQSEQDGRVGINGDLRARLGLKKESAETSNLQFEIKSLKEIKGEKSAERKPRSDNGERNKKRKFITFDSGDSVDCTHKNASGAFGVKTLAEIRAEKDKRLVSTYAAGGKGTKKPDAVTVKEAMPSAKSLSNSAATKKRSISPIRFDTSPHKRLKLTKSCTRNASNSIIKEDATEQLIVNSVRLVSISEAKPDRKSSTHLRITNTDVSNCNNLSPDNQLPLSSLNCHSFRGEEANPKEVSSQTCNVSRHSISHLDSIEDESFLLGEDALEYNESDINEDELLL